MGEPQKVQGQESETPGVSDADIDAVLAACDGDPRAAIRALLIGQQFLEVELEEARREASWGYVRGRPSRWKDAAEG